MDTRPGRYAAIDIGTVTCRLLIADNTWYYAYDSIGNHGCH